MASRREIKRRIKSISNTAQITRAMQMVAASRMRRAQARVTSSRPYSQHIRGIVSDVAAKSGAESHPLLVQRDIKNAEIVLMSPDRGLAGALVSNIKRETMRLVERTNEPIRVIAIGRKGRDFTVRSRLQLVAEFTGLSDRASITDISPIAAQVLEDYQNGDADIVHLVYTEFVSTLKQQTRVVQLLPVVPPESDESRATWNYEPDNPQAVLSGLLPRYVEFTLYQAFLELMASFYSAQMIAMSNATDNANELVQDLTLLGNKARQAEITKEIAEISGAAEALRTAGATS